MKKLSLFFILFVYLFFSFHLASAAHKRHSCLATRVAFDIGSSTTKMKMAIVNVCSQKVVRILAEDDRKVAYKEDLTLSETGGFSDSAREAGISTLLEFKETAEAIADQEDLRPIQYRAVATSAFRNANNADDFLRQILSRTSIPVTVIEAPEEAMLGFQAVTTLFPDIPSSNIVVWDVGGGSIQLSAINESGNLDVFFTETLASVTMRNYVIQALKGGNLRAVTTPNPIGRENLESALNYVRDFAKRETPQNLKEKIAEATVIGIGGVHYHSVKDQVLAKENGEFTRAAILHALEERLARTDEELALLNEPKLAQIQDSRKKERALNKAKEHVSASVTNLILVYGFMEALGIEQLKVANVNMTNTLLIDPKYWTKSQ